MAYADLTTAEKTQLAEFLRDYRAAMADVVRGLRRQELLTMAFNTAIAPIWAKVVNGDVIPDDSGLAGAHHGLTKAMYTPMLTFSTNLLAGIFSDSGGAVATVWPDRETVEGYAVQLAGPGNVG